MTRKLREEREVSSLRDAQASKCREEREVSSLRDAQASKCREEREVSNEMPWRSQISLDHQRHCSRVET